MIDNINNNLDSCLQLFMTRGLRAVSIEDIVSNTPLTKKELYNVYGNKKGIIKASLQHDIKSSEEIFEAAVDSSNNAIDELLFAHKKIMARVSKVNPVFFFDLKKFYTEIANNHSEKKLSASYSFINNNMIRGINENIYRSEINKDIVAKIWISKFDIIKEQKLFPLQEYDLNKLTRQFIELHLRSIANDNGINLLNQYFSKELIPQ